MPRSGSAGLLDIVQAEAGVAAVRGLRVRLLGVRVVVQTERLHEAVDGVRGVGAVHRVEAVAAEPVDADVTIAHSG